MCVYLWKFMRIKRNRKEVEQEEKKIHRDQRGRMLEVDLDPVK